MKLEIIIFAIFLFVIPGAVLGQYRLSIEISGFRNNQGVVMLQVFNEQEQVIAERKEPVSEGKCLLIIEGLKAGKYAVRYFHDENLSGEMETNTLGIPVEGYGFSNNAKGLFGPPPFEKRLFEVNADKNIQLKPVY
jgi:uncharacterized protein (DUF2141 family)